MLRRHNAGRGSGPREHPIIRPSRVLPEAYQPKDNGAASPGRGACPPWWAGPEAGALPRYTCLKERLSDDWAGGVTSPW